MTYRADIDGLRAVAVLAVVLYHAFPTVLPGGFVGVDIFFVISGFLISGIILDALRAGRFAFADFYARRVRRIFPALALVLAAVLAYATLVLLPAERALLARDAAGGAGFVANLLFWSEIGYFDRAAATKPLLHLWSLGVEEQFYIAWPLVLWALHRAAGLRLTAIAVLALASFALNVAQAGGDGAAAFYSPLARFWELALGAALAARARQPGRDWTPAQRDAASLAGLALILFSVALLRASLAFPGWWALPPTIGAALLLAAGPAALINRRILALRPAVAIGLVSYPFYLWHWPLLSYAHIIHYGRALKPLLALGLVAASLALAALTWRLLERPIRAGRLRRAATPALAAAMALVGLAGIALWQHPGGPANGAGLDTARLNAAIGDGIFRPTRDMTVRDVGGKLVATLVPPLADSTASPPGVLLVGDSILFQYGPRAQALHEAGRLARATHFVVGPSCAPFPGTIRPPPFTHCTGLAAMVREVLATTRIGTVVLGAYWPRHIGPDILVETAAGPVPADTPAAIDAVFAHLAAEVARLRALGLRVVLLLIPPADPRFDPRRMIARTWHGYSIAPDAMAPVPLAELTPATTDINRRLAAIAAATGAEIRDPLPDICGPGPGCDPFFAAGEPKFSDDKHLRPAFVRGHVTFLDDLLTANN